ARSVPELALLVRPPVWMLSGVPEAAAPLLPGVAGAEERELPPAVRALMAQVECNLRRALLWALVYPRRAGAESNPFRALFEAHRVGLYPLGYDGERFVVFARGGVQLA
ncbi:MAG TPA: hypothetical protein VKA84_22080, partial [Gemmatimonadaceae bacterium]|nr:hypothetical protein [Gemmatimonadaceae bacterium]